MQLTAAIWTGENWYINMRILVQRVSEASVSIDNELKASINRGFLLLLGVGREDSEEDADWLVRKVSALRVFSDEDGKMNLNIQQVEGEILLVSQFTLYADTRKGNRPGFSQAAPPDEGERLYRYVRDAFIQKGIPLKTGEFGADMQIALVNDGPVTIMMDSADRLKPRRE